MSKKIFLNSFKLVGINFLEKEEDPSSLRTKSLFRALNGIQNVGTPHDWEDYEKYKKELDQNETN